MKPGKQPVTPKKRDAAPAGPVPAYQLNIPAWMWGFLFAASSIVVYRLWWRHFPIVPRVFPDYWSRDARFLIPAFPEFFVAWGHNLLVTLALAAFEVVSWRAGRRALKWATGREHGGLWGFLLALGLGNGIIGTAALGAGMAGLLFRPVFAGVLGVALAFSAVRFVRWRRARILAGNPPALPGLPALGRLEWVFVAFGAFIALGNYLPALEPEWFYDSLVYHLAVPARWMTHHRICQLPDTFFSNFPFLQEMQYMVFMVLGVDVSARLLHWANGVLCAVAVYAFARPLMGRRNALLAMAIFQSLPQLRFLQHVTMVELGLSWYSILAFHCFMRAVKMVPAEGEEGVPRRAWLFVAAWFLGFGQGTKYLGIYISGILIAWLLLESARGRAPWGRTLRDLALITAWGAVWTVPWLAKNWLFTGNPVFPMMGTVFPALNWDEALHKRWMYDNTKYGTGRGHPFNWLMMPVLASVETSHFGTFTLNPFFLLFLPALAFLRGVPQPIRFLGGATGVYFLVWTFTSQQTRFMMPISHVASVATAFVVAEAFKGRRVLQWMGWASAGWIFLNCGYGEIQNRFTNNAMVPYASGWIDRPGIMRLGVQYYEAAKLANEIVPANGRVLFFGGDENYYCTRPLFCSSIYDKCWAGELAKRAKSPEELMGMMKRRRVTHMLFHEPRADEYSTHGMFEWGRPAQDRFLSFWGTYCRLVFQARGVFLFELTDKPVGRDERKYGEPMCFSPKDDCRKARELMARADTLFRDNRAEEGLAVTQELVTLMPRLAHAYSYRAYAWGSMRKSVNAQKDYEKSISLGYPTVAAYYNLGLIYEAQGRRGDALDVYLRGLSVEPDYTQLKERTAQLALDLGKRGVALQLYTELALRDPSKAAYAARVAELRAMPGGVRQ